MHILYVCTFSCVRCRSHITKSLRPLWFIAAPALERPAPSSRGHAESQEPRETWDSERKQGSHSWSAACPGCGFRMRHAISSSGVRHINNNNIIITACTVNLSKPYRIRAECVFSVFFPVGPGGGEGGLNGIFRKLANTICSVCTVCEPRRQLAVSVTKIARQRIDTALCLFSTVGTSDFALARSNRFPSGRGNIAVQSDSTDDGLSRANHPNTLPSSVRRLKTSNYRPPVTHFTTVARISRNVNFIAYGIESDGRKQLFTIGRIFVGLIMLRTTIPSVPLFGVG